MSSRTEKEWEDEVAFCQGVVNRHVSGEVSIGRMFLYDSGVFRQYVVGRICLASVNGQAGVQQALQEVVDLLDEFNGGKR